MKMGGHTHHIALTSRHISDIIVYVKKYLIAFVLWLSISLLTIYLSRMSSSNTPENLDWTINATK